MRAVGGAQSRSSKIPALVPTYQTRFRLAGYEHDLPQVHLFQRLRNDLTISSNPPQVLPKEAPNSLQSPRPDNLDTGDDRPLQPEVFRLSASAGDNMPNFCRHGVFLGEPEQFVDEVVKQATLWTWVPSCHPRLPKRCWRTRNTKTCNERNNERLSTMKFWFETCPGP